MMKYHTSIVLLGVFVSGAALAAPLVPILPQFKGMTIQNQCGKHGAQFGKKFCAGASWEPKPTGKMVGQYNDLDPESNFQKGGGYRSPGAQYLYSYNQQCLSDIDDHGRKMAKIDRDVAVLTCKDYNKQYLQGYGKSR